MKNFYPYNLQSEQTVELESHKIVGGKIRLDHIPKEGSLTVRGFVEAKSASNLQSNEFFCSYRADSQYREANCTVCFWSGRSGQTVYCSYIAIGTIVTADDMNEIGDFMTAASKNFSRQDDSLTGLKNLIVETRTEARTALTEHNQYRAAHSDIRDDINTLTQENLNAHADLIRRIADTDANLTAHKAQVIAERNQAILNHNTDTAAHVDIRNAISNLRGDIDDEISELRGELDMNVEELSTDLAALRGDLNSEVANLRFEISSISGLSSISDDVDILISGLSSVQDDINNLSGGLSAVQGNVANLSAEVEILSGTLDDVQSDLAGLSTIYYDLTRLEHKIDGLSSLPDFDDLDALLSSKVDTADLDARLNNLPDFEDLDAALDSKVDKISGKQLSTNDFTDAYKTQLDGLNTALDSKVDKISGKQLSTNDFTDAYKDKLDALNLQIILGTTSSTVNGAMWLEIE